MAANLTPSQLANTPLMPNPSGAPPNFVDPPSRGPMAIAVVSVIMGLMVIVLLLRVHARAFVVKMMGWDDLTVILGSAMCIIQNGFSIKVFAKGPPGRHAWDVSYAQLLDPNYFQAQYVVLLGTSIGGFLVKITVLLLLRRIFPSRVHKVANIFIWIGIVLVTIFNIITLVMFAYYCSPRPGAGGLPPAICQDPHGPVNPLAIASAAFNMFIDLYILCIPLPIIRSLNMHLKRKIGTMLVLATGLLACLCSILSVYYKVVFSSETDTTWAQIDGWLLGNVEMMIGIITACLPALPALYNHLETSGYFSIRSLASLLSSRSRNASTNRTKSNPSNFHELSDRESAKKSGSLSESGTASRDEYRNGAAALTSSLSEARGSNV